MNKFRWQHLEFEELNDDHLRLLFKWRNSDSFLNYLTARPKSKSLEDFKIEIKNDFSNDRHLQYIISFQEAYIGTIYSYSFNKLDKYCFISVFTVDKVYNSGLGIKAVVVFSKFLFERFDLFKIYFDIYEFNFSLITALKKRGIGLEGHFLKQHLYKGKRYDVFRFAIYENQISSWVKKNS